MTYREVCFMQKVYAVSCERKNGEVISTGICFVFDEYQMKICFESEREVMIIVTLPNEQNDRFNFLCALYSPKNNPLFIAVTNGIVLKKEDEMSIILLIDEETDIVIDLSNELPVSEETIEKWKEYEFRGPNGEII